MVSNSIFLQVEPETPVSLYDIIEMTTPQYSKHLQLRLGALAANSALDETVGVRLRSENFGIRSGVLQALEPAQICYDVSTWNFLG